MPSADLETHQPSLEGAPDVWRAASCAPAGCAFEGGLAVFSGRVRLVVF